MKFSESPLKGVFVIELEPFTDERGWFARTYCEKEFSQHGLNGAFVQMNQSFNSRVGTFRGLHYQEPPYEEAKLIHCVAGSVLDIVVDLRKGSPTFLQSFQVELSVKNSKMIYIPGGLAHGFLTLQPFSSLIYHHTQFYNPEADRGLRYDDPKLNIELPKNIEIISDKDKNHALLQSEFAGLEV